MRNGTKGAAWDLGLYMRDFVFQLQEVQMPLKLFHGERDVNAPIALGRSTVAKLPSAHLVTYEDEAHFSTLCNHIDEIILAVGNR
jgi:pimeloyl-ACP methyl ester carboxylesterase